MQAWQDAVDAVVVSVFDDLVAAVGADYEDNIRGMLDHLKRLLNDGLLPSVCPLACVEFEDKDGYRPHMAPSGRAVCTFAFQAAYPNHKLPDVDTGLLKRATAARRLRLRPVALPEKIDKSAITFREPIGGGGEGGVSSADWQDEAVTKARSVAVKVVKIGDSDAALRCALDTIALAYLASKTSRLVCRLQAYYCHTDNRGRTVGAVLELCPWSLADALRAEPLPPLNAARVCWQVATALAALHGDLHLKHLDVKPANILLSDTGDALLTDFGISQRGCTDLTAVAAAAKGTLAYASPEQRNGRPVRLSSDVFSLGRTLQAAVRGVDGDGVPQNTRAGGDAAALEALAADMTVSEASERPRIDAVADRLCAALQQLSGVAAEPPFCSEVCNTMSLPAALLQKKKARARPLGHAHAGC